VPAPLFPSPFPADTPKCWRSLSATGDLVALYARSLELSPELMDDLARRTEGASPAFIKEFLRRIAQHHLDSDAKGNLTKATAEAALHEMLFSGGALNTKLLGGEAVSNEAMGRST
jgi:hypothetical protein